MRANLPIAMMLFDRELGSPVYRLVGLSAIPVPLALPEGKKFRDPAEHPVLCIYMSPWDLALEPARADDLLESAAEAGFAAGVAVLGRRPFSFDAEFSDRIGEAFRAVLLKAPRIFILSVNRLHQWTAMEDVSSLVILHEQITSAERMRLLMSVLNSLGAVEPTDRLALVSMTRSIWRPAYEERYKLSSALDHLRHLIPLAGKCLASSFRTPQGEWRLAFLTDPPAAFLIRPSFFEFERTSARNASLRSRAITLTPGLLYAGQVLQNTTSGWVKLVGGRTRLVYAAGRKAWVEEAESLQSSTSWVNRLLMTGGVGGPVVGILRVFDVEAVP